jgi:hypothetical protein
LGLEVERGHVDDEAISHVAFDGALVGFLIFWIGMISMSLVMPFSAQ